MDKRTSRNVHSPNKMMKETTVSTFYSSKRSHRQYFSMKKNYSNYSETTYISPGSSLSPEKSTTARYKNASLSPDRKSAYWQNWLLPEGIRKQMNYDQPSISATSMCTIFADNNQIFHSENCLETRQIASLTKIMTAFTVINICNTYGVKIR